MKRGTQIAYVPDHADGDLSHPDVEYGFVTSVKEHAAFCRYWSKGNPGELRTKSNSELTPFRNLVEATTCSERTVQIALREIEGA